MNALIEQGVIQEMICNGNFAYVLSGNESFLPVEYKVLHSKTGDGFVKCVKMSFNGHTQLYYITEGLRPLLSVVSSMNVDGFLTMVTNLLTNVVQAKSNGFLSCQNIEVGFEKIFVEPSTLKVSLVYVPLNRHIHSDYDAFENELRTGLVRLINSLPQITSARVTRLSIALSNGMLGSFKELGLDQRVQRYAGPGGCDRGDRPEQVRGPDPGCRPSAQKQASGAGYFRQQP